MPAFLVAVCLVLPQLAIVARAGTQLGEEVERALAAARVKANAGDVVAQFSLASITERTTLRKRSNGFARRLSSNTRRLNFRWACSMTSGSASGKTMRRH